jgi:hypothetical protein
MNYYIDTEFLEGTQNRRILGIPFGQTKPTIDLISIGIVGEDGRELYLISKDFNLKEAWNRYEWKSFSAKGGIGETTRKKVYWIRENVLKPIWEELTSNLVGCRTNITGLKYDGGLKSAPNWHFSFSYKSMKYLINKYGKTNKEIAEKVKEFVKKDYLYQNADTTTQWKDRGHPQFYGYFADYDWVVFCWLFGKMIDLPKGFSWYCIDLKQMLDEKGKTFMPLKDLKNLKDYPKKTNEHNALADAKWNMDLHIFIQSL